MKARRELQKARNTDKKIQKQAPKIQIKEIRNRHFINKWLKADNSPWGNDNKMVMTKVKGFNSSQETCLIKFEFIISSIFPHLQPNVMVCYFIMGDLPGLMEVIIEELVVATEKWIKHYD